jgi:thioredoxin 1
MKNKNIALIAIIAGVAIIVAIFVIPFLSTTGSDGVVDIGNSSQPASGGGNSENVTTVENNSNDKSKSADTKNIKVTFIELGSVKCIPCKMMQPVMKKIEETFPLNVEVVFYDVWTEKDKARAVEYNINAIPTQVFLDASGKEYYRHVGFFPFEDLEKILKMKL